MINIQTLGTLLRTLQSGELSARPLSPLQPLAPTQAVKPVSSEDAQAQQSATREQGRLPAPARLTPLISGQAASAAAPASLALPDTATVVSLRSMAGGDTLAALPLAGARETGPSGGLTAVQLASASPLPPAAESGTSLRLSTAALAIDQLVRQPGGEPIRPAGPLVAAPNVPDLPKAVAHALQRSIAGSGVFYESHLAQWALQQRPVALLQQEPQASWTSAIDGGTAPALNAAAAADDAMAAPTAPSTSPVTAPALAPLPDAVPVLVRQQLDVLETGQILWRGDLWPGQPATIEISEDEQARAAGEAPLWRTRLALDLPGLGEIEARLALSGTRLEVHLEPRSPDSVGLLREALPALAEALAARALDLTPVVIRHVDQR